MNDLRVGYAEVASFYAAVERLDDPGLRARPVIVGGSPSKRGKVQSASLEALEAGVRLGMAIEEAAVRCPGAALVRTDMKRYREVSALLHIALREALDGIETDGMAGAFFELPKAARNDTAAAGAVADRLAEHVREALGLPLRVGVAPVKFLARLAASEAGAAGVVCVASPQVDGFLGPMSPARLPGVGAKTRGLLADLNVESVAALRAFDPLDLERKLGRQAGRILALARGQDDSPVRSAAHPKTMSLEFTFDRAVVDRNVVEAELERLCRSAEANLRQQRLQADRVSIKLRYEDANKSQTRTRTLLRPVQHSAEAFSAARRLLDRTEVGIRPVRLLGISLSGLAKQREDDDQLDLFSS